MKTTSRRTLIGFGIAGILLGIAGCVIGALGLLTAGDANDKTDAILEAREASRIIACESANDTASRINGLNDRVQDTLRTAVAPTGRRTPEQQAAADKFLTEQIASYETLKVPLRDCSPAGVDAFYDGKNLTTTSTTEAPS